VRTLLEEIVIDLDLEANEVALILHWKGGAHSLLRIPRQRPGQKVADTPSDLIDAVRVLARICSDDAIAAALNRHGLTTGHGHRWTRTRVCSLRSKRDIDVHDPNAQRSQGWMNLREAAAYLRLTPKTLRRAAQRNRLRFERPLSQGPWVFHRAELDAFRHRRGSQSTLQDLPEQQLNLMESTTYRGDAV